MSDSNQTSEVLAILRALRQGQEEALSLQREALQTQRQLAELTRDQFARSEALHANAEKIQARQADLVSASRRVLKVILPIVVALLAYLSWLIFRR